MATRISKSDDRILRELSKSGKSDAEIATHFNLPIRTIRARKARLGIGVKRERKAYQHRIRNGIFSKADKYVTTSESVLDGINDELSTIIGLRKYIWKKLSVKKNLNDKDIAMIYGCLRQFLKIVRTHNRLMKNYTSIAETQKFIAAFSKVIFATSTYEQRMKFRQEIGGSGIVFLFPREEDMAKPKIDEPRG
jgi:hypothetical protein